MALRELEQRFGIPSVRGGALRWFYLFFGAGTLYLTIANTLSQLSRSGAGDWLYIQSIITEQLVRAAGASLILSYIITDGGDMVISAILRERNRKKDLEEGRREGLKEGLKEGRQEGRSEVQSQWESWNQRRQEAEKRGEPFNEPPPNMNNQNGAPTEL